MTRFGALGVALITGVLYFVASRYVVILNDPVNEGAGFWPGAGITVAALVVTRVSWWPAILVAVGFAEFANDAVIGYSTAASVLWAAANMVEPLVAAYLVRRVGATALSDVRDVTWFVVCVVIATTVGGMVGAVGTLVDGSTFDYGYIAVRWAAGDGLGMLTVAPAVVLLVRWRVRVRRLFDPELALVMAVVTVAAVVIFYLTPGGATGSYLIVPPLLWAAVRFRVMGAALSTFVAAQLANHAQGLGYGEFGIDGESTLTFQVFLAAVTISVLVVGARTDESLAHQEAELRTAAALADLDASAERLRVSEARFRGLFESTTTGIVMADLDGCFVAVNPAFCSIVGRSEHELIGSRFADVTHEDDRTSSREHHDKLIAGDVSAYRLEKRYRRPDGSVRYVDVAVGIVRDERDEPLHTVASIVDVTGRRVTEQRLERSRALQRVAGDLASVGGWSIDVVDNAVTWSEEIHRILEYPEGDPASLEVGLDRYAPEHRTAVEQAIAACARDGTPFDLTVKFTTFRDRSIWVRVTAEPQWAEDGSVDRIVGALQDVTAQRAATTEATGLAERLVATIESISDSFFTLDRDFRFTYVNRRAEEVLHRDRASLLGRVIWDEFLEAAGTEVDHAYRRAMTQHTTEDIDEYYFEPLDTWFSIRAYPSETGIAVYFQDITAQREVRRAVEERDVRLADQAELLDAASDAITVRDLDGRISYWNHSAERLYGWEFADVRGQSARDLLYDDLHAFDHAMRQLVTDGAWHGELVQLHRSGRRLLMECRWTLVYDGDDEPRSVLAINADITERRELEEQLRRVQRMESIGTLAGGLSHDLNNILAPILISVDVLERDGLGEGQDRFIDIIRSCARRASDMVGQILTFARGLDGHRVPIDIDVLMAEVERITEETFLKVIRIEREVSSDHWPVMGDPTQLHQVLLNLCLNARDAMPDGGTLHLACDTVLVDAATAARHDGAAPGPYVRIDVEDDGGGMPAEVIDRVFEPFFTTKRVGEGTGLGLSTAAGIVQSHEGFMHVSSEVGRGTTVSVYLPTASGTEVAAGAGDVADLAGPTSSTGGGRLVLVVDDEEPLRTTLRHMLEQHSYRVLEAADGAVAVELFRTRGDDVDIVLTDMMMPGMDGAATIRALREIRPDIPIVAASGLHTAAVAECEGQGADLFLTKPFTVAALLGALRQAVDQRT